MSYTQPTYKISFAGQDPLISNKASEIIMWLREDDRFETLATEQYMETLDGMAPSDEDLSDMIWEDFKGLAEDCGYVVEKLS